MEKIQELWIYNKQSNSIKQKATMARPVKVVLGSDTSTHKDSLEIFETITNEYNQHIASLKEYACVDNCKEIWKDSCEIIEGIDFELRCNNAILAIRGIYFAIPIHKELEDDSREFEKALQDEMHDLLEAGGRLGENGEDYAYHVGIVSLSIQKLKQTFSIKRK